MESEVRSVLRGGEFWSPDGSDVDNDSMVSRSCALLKMLSRIPSSGRHLIPPLSAETVAAAAFLRYRAEEENAAARKSMTFADFRRECRLEHVALDGAKSKKAVSALHGMLKSLVGKLPYVGAEKAKPMNLVASLYYLKDVLQHEEGLIYDLQRVEEKSSEEECDTVGEEEEEEILGDTSLDDVDSYIRSPEEVKALKPLYEKLYDEKS